MKVLHLEDNAGDAALVHAMLAAEFPGCAVAGARSRGEFLARLGEAPAPDLVLSDFSLPAFDGLAALALAGERLPDVPFIFVSGSIGEERAIRAVRGGAYDYVLKDNLARLPMVVQRALAEFALRRHRREDERRLLELAGIIERATEAIVVSDMAGRITLWNDGAARLYGIRAADAVGRPAADLLAHDAFAHAHAARDAAFETGEWQQEAGIATADGRNLVVDIRMTLVRDDAGRPSARLSIATDITEKKKLEGQFLRAQRLESLGMLAAGIAHDLNNVLTPVLMSATLLRQRATAVEDLRVLDILEQSAERGSALVRQILGFAHGTGGGFRPVQVKHLLRDVCHIVEATFPKSIALDEQVPGDLWPIQANPTQVHQILLNLAVNARDAMAPRGGTLRLRAENVRLAEREAQAVVGAKPGAFLVLEVGDTGTGIPPGVLARIWEPFFTTKGEGKGTGLGLATVRGIAAAHGGFVTVETCVGQGTTFRVFLPADGQPGDEAAAVSSPALPRGRGELVLIVDDEAHVGDVAAAILTRHGYRTLTCRDGVEAVTVFAERRTEIQVVVSDVNMPILDGPALTVVLRRLRPDVPILTMTGLDDRGAAPAAEPAEFTMTIRKPFTAETLLTALHRVRHGEPAAAAVR